MLLATENYFPNSLYQFIFLIASFDNYHFLTTFKNYWSPILRLANLMRVRFSFSFFTFHLIITRLRIFYIFNNFYSIFNCLYLLSIYVACLIWFLFVLCLYNLIIHTASIFSQSVIIFNVVYGIFWGYGLILRIYYSKDINLCCIFSFICLKSFFLTWSLITLEFILFMRGDDFFPSRGKSAVFFFTNLTKLSKSVLDFLFCSISLFCLFLYCFHTVLIVVII